MSSEESDTKQTVAPPPQCAALPPQWTVIATVGCGQALKESTKEWSIEFRGTVGEVETSFYWAYPYLASLKEWQAVIKGEGEIKSKLYETWSSQIVARDGMVEIESWTFTFHLQNKLRVVVPHAAIAAPLAAAIASAVAQNCRFSSRRDC